MIDFDDVDELFKEIKMGTKQLANIVLRVDPDTELMIFYGMAFLSDSYSTLAEEFLTQNKGVEASYFSKKSLEIRRLCTDIFKKYPERDYYTGLTYKFNEKTPTDIKPDQLEKMAQFCAANLNYDQNMTADNKALAKHLHEEFKKKRKTAAEKKVIGVLEHNYKEIISKKKLPNLQNLYDVLLLMNNAAQVVQIMEEKLKGQKEKPAEKEGLAGFMKK